MRLTKKLKEQILKHAREQYPNESCGLVINKEYIACKNTADDPTKFFIINPVDIVRASKLGVIDAYVHSHPNATSKPSQADLVQMNTQSKPWIICGYAPNEIEDIKLYKPTGFKLNLLGRQYYHGLQDCYSIIKDYYFRELNIVLNDYERLDNWWLKENTKSLYLDNFKKEGFIEVNDTIKKHDVILFKIGKSYHINHAGIFLEDGALKSEDTSKVIGNSLFIHHPYNRLSLREVYGDSWGNRTVKILRHRDLL